MHYEDLKDVILVGNSYAGMVITGVAAKVPERLKQLVYLDAYLPEDEQCEAELWPSEMRASVENDEAAKSGLRKPPDPAVFGITDTETVKWLKARWTSHPLNTYYQPVSAGNAQSAAIPRVYIHCVGSPKTTTPIFAPFAVKAKANGWPVYEMKTGHLVMFTMPEELAELLTDAAEKY